MTPIVLVLVLDLFRNAQAGAVDLPPNSFQVILSTSNIQGYVSRLEERLLTQRLKPRGLKS
jgi:hypothetical protein